MLVKPAYNRGAMKTSNSRVSHLDIHNTLFSLMGLESVAYGKNMYDVSETEKRETTVYYGDKPTNSEKDVYITTLHEYVVGENVADQYYTGYIYDKGQKLGYEDYVKTVEIGKTYKYEEMIPYASYGFFSWGDAKEGYLFGNMKRGEMYFKLDKVPENGVNVRYDLLAWLPTSPSELTIQVKNGAVLYSSTFEGSVKEPVTVHVPQEAFDENGIVVLEFITPNAKLSSDHRWMNFGYYSFTIEEQKGES